MKKCTWCGAEYPDEAKVCALDQTALGTADGRPIVEPEPKPEEVQPIRRRRSTPEREMRIGGLFCLGGIFVTVMTYEAASKAGGTYIVAWGAILFGALKFFSGLLGRNSQVEEMSPDVETSAGGVNAQSLLNLAARLESKDRAKAIDLYQKVIALFPDSRASAEAERNIRVLTEYKE